MTEDLEQFRTAILQAQNSVNETLKSVAYQLGAIAQLLGQLAKADDSIVSAVQREIDTVKAGLKSAADEHRRCAESINAHLQRIDKERATSRADRVIYINLAVSGLTLAAIVLKIFLA